MATLIGRRRGRRRRRRRRQRRRRGRLLRSARIVFSCAVVPTTRPLRRLLQTRPSTGGRTLGGGLAEWGWSPTATVVKNLGRHPADVFVRDPLRGWTPVRQVSLPRLLSKRSTGGILRRWWAAGWAACRRGPFRPDWRLARALLCAMAMTGTGRTSGARPQAVPPVGERSAIITKQALVGGTVAVITVAHGRDKRAH